MSASRNVYGLYLELPAPLAVCDDAKLQPHYGHHDHVDTPYPTLQLFVPEAITTNNHDRSTSRLTSLKSGRYRYKASQSGLCALVDVLNPICYPQQAQTYVDGVRHKRQLQQIKKEAASSFSQTPIPEYGLDTATDTFASRADREDTECADDEAVLQSGKLLRSRKSGQ